MGFLISMEKTGISHRAESIKYEQFDAVILGTDYSEDLASIGENCPTILLPLGGKPILSYQLSYLASNSIHHVFIAAAAVQSKKIVKYIEKRKIDEMVIEVVPIEKNAEGNYSIEDVFVELSKKITKSFVVMDGQVITDVNLTSLAELHCKKKSLVTMCLYGTKPAEAPHPGKPQKGVPEQAKRKGHYTAYGLQCEIDFATSSTQARVVFVANDSDFESGCTISKTLVKKVEKISLYGDLTPISICICQPSLLLYSVSYKKSFLSFFNDVVPFLIQNQFSKGLTKEFEQLYPDVKQEEKGITALLEASEGSNRSQVHIWTRMCIPLNNIYININSKQNYLFANSEAMKMQEKTLFAPTGENWPHLLAKYTKEIEEMNNNKKKIPPPGAPAFLKQVTDGSLVSEGLEVKEGVIINKSLVCPGAKIGKGTKIVNSIVHNDAVIGENCSLISCVVGAKAKISDKTTIKDKLIGRKQSFNEEDLDSQ
eukprot:TRINITY_DN5066_c0_g1_i1.p1 TRINITY_DN5066_c0_g1~~TRINITY_DN5066_c0_g1_i1.p1  ORF type:complete len:483 (+),score=91.78 TRINITY_DN5066_c0_g1_i1:3-1451(+)